MTQDQSTCCAAQHVISDDEIRERAHDLWERHHRPEGFEVKFWLMAQRELLAERRSGTELAANEAPAIPAQDVTDPNPTRIGER